MTEVGKALKCLQDFSLCSQLQDRVLDAITALEKQLNNAILHCKNEGVMATPKSGVKCLCLYDTLEWCQIP